MQLLVNILVKSLYGEQVRKHIEGKLACRSVHRMMSECDEKVKDYGNVGYGSFNVKMVDDAGLEDKVRKLYTMPLRLGSFVLSNSKRMMNNFIQAIVGFYTNDVH